jgi:hypothetical protein
MAVSLKLKNKNGDYLEQLYRAVFYAAISTFLM